MRHGIYKRTFYYFLLSMSVIIIVFMAFFIHYVNLRYAERFKEDQVYATEKTAESVSGLLKNIKQNAYFLCCNDILAQTVVNKYGYDFATQRTLLSQVFSLNTGSPSALLTQSAYAALFLDDQFPVANRMKGNFSFDALSFQRVYSALDVEEDAWYQETVKKQAEIYSFLTQESDQMIFFAHLLRNINIADPRYSEDVGVVLYAMPKRTMVNLLRDSQMDSRSITVLTYNNQVMSSTDVDLFPTGQTITNDALALDVNQDIGSVTNASVQGVRYAVSSSGFEGGWKVILLVPGQSVSQALKSLAPMGAGFIVVLSLVALGMSLLFARRLVRPIVTLSKKMLYTRSTQTLPIKTSVPHSGDEIESLYHSYNDMVENIHIISNQIKEKNETLRVTELKALQAQINPHFIYNTLDSVTCIALLSGENDIATMVASLISILKYSVDFSKTAVTLREELDYLQQYIQIQRLRYVDNFVFQCDVPEKYDGVRVSKISLQPLVENALFHASHEKNALVIRVSCEEMGGDFLIHVSDNGSGANAAQLNDMLRADQAGECYGIGIRNVNKRIQIMEGENYGIHYEQLENGGLDAIITIPLTP